MAKLILGFILIRMVSGLTTFRRQFQPVTTISHNHPRPQTQQHGKAEDFDPSAPYDKCDPRGNPCKNGLFIPMWKPDISHLQLELFELSHPNHRQSLRGGMGMADSRQHSNYTFALAESWKFHSPAPANIKQPLSREMEFRTKQIRRKIRLIQAFRGIVYFLILVYLFIGVSIIADRFMAAIEVITSKERDIAVKKSVVSPLASDPYAALLPPSHRKPRQEVTIVTVRIWNETVSNLTLMALGSSAPEILLSIIEVIGKNFEAGDLGPGTIVGSAAFNLFIIVGLCILVVPTNDLRKIRYLRVFFLTATWSIFAYIWLYLIIAVISPGRVTVTEALITFAFFPLTVLSAYIVDVQMYKHWWTVSKRYGAKYKKRPIAYVNEGDEAFSLPDLTTIDDIDLGGGVLLEEAPPGTRRGSRSLFSRMSSIPATAAGGESSSTTPSFGRRKISLVVDGTRRTMPLYDFSGGNKGGGTIDSSSKSFAAPGSGDRKTNVGKFFRRKSTLLNITLPFLKSESEEPGIDDIPTEYVIGSGAAQDTKLPISESVTSALSNIDDRAYRDYVEFEKTRQAYMTALTEARAKYPDADLQTLEGLASYNVLNKGPKSRAYYRIQATRKLLTKQGNVMGRNQFRKLSSRLFAGAAPQSSSKTYNGPLNQGSGGSDKLASLGEGKQLTPWKDNAATPGEGDGITRISFDPGHYTIMESAGKCHLRVIRIGGNLESVIKVDYETRNGTAKAGEDYGHTAGTIVFDKGKIETSISVPIIDDELFEEDEYFYVDLRHLRFASEDNEIPSPVYTSSEMASPVLSPSPSKNLEVRISPEDEGWYQRIKRSLVKSPSSTLNSINKTATMLRKKRRNPLLQFENPRTATVMIFDDDHAGIFCFDKDIVRCNENCGVINIKVIRKSGARGKVYVPYETNNITALGVDPDELEVGGNEVATFDKNLEKSPNSTKPQHNKGGKNVFKNFSNSFKRATKSHTHTTTNQLNINAQKLNQFSDPVLDSSNILSNQNSSGNYVRTKNQKYETTSTNQEEIEPLTPKISQISSLNYSNVINEPVNNNNNSSSGQSTGDSTKDYVKAKGYLVFEDEQIESYIPIRIIDTEQYEKSATFIVKLGQPIWVKRDKDEDIKTNMEGLPSPRPSMFEPPKFEPDIKGSPILTDPSSCSVTIIESKDFKLTIDKLLKKTNIALLVGTSTWKDQFIDAFTVQSDEGDEKESEMGEKKVLTPSKGPSCWDYTLHFITLFWKVLFAFVPPTDYWGGWCCFIFAIIWIGILTAVIGDIAAAFGCTIGLKDSVTAISFVALGTSVPDTFASKVAATQDEYADASIGNVTGSNAVNVFLGIGLAWALASIYHAVKGTTFFVDPGSLAFSVTIFCVLAVLAIAVLMVKRFITKGELGGPLYCKLITSGIFFVFWFIYLILASLESYCKIQGF